jgi:hypothetical protein
LLTQVDKNVNHELLVFSIQFNVIINQLTYPFFRPVLMPS